MVQSIKELFRSSWLVLFIIGIAACQSQVRKPQELTNKFSDPIIVQIHDDQDKRNVAALMNYLDHENAVYRTEATLAFGSVQDSSVIPRLGYLLNDPSSKVRKAAAYALGQTYDSAAMKYLAQALQYEDSVFVRKELFQALGKVVTQPKISLLYNQSFPTQKEKEGLAWGLYRAGLRNVHDGVTVELAASFLDTVNSYDTRLGAAHFLAGTKNTDLSKYEKLIIASATQDPAATVRIAATAALMKIHSERVLAVLRGTLLADVDHRVRITALQALQSYQYPAVEAALFNALQDTNSNVAITAAMVINDLAKETEKEHLYNAGLTHQNFRIKASLLGTALKNAEDQRPVINDIRQQYEESKNPYFKASLLTALGNALPSYKFLVKETFTKQHPAIKTAGINALAMLREHENFPEELKPAFAGYFKRAIMSGDIAMVAVASSVLSNSNLNFRNTYDSYDFLYEAKKQLVLPKDIEALQALNSTIAYLEGKEQFSEAVNAFNHPIDWKLVKTIRRDQHVRIKTTKGDIVLRLLVEKAPGTVANFVSLCKSGYFNGKNFHRVVPNFVVQGGCNRGDGYGSEAYSLRSEFANLNYQTGSVGMASAGKDTEGTQWFITHSPTPHLDGRYTIFAQVTSGMDVVYKIEVGDKILSTVIR